MAQVQPPPSGLLRSPGSVGDALDKPLVDELRRRNRYRKPTALARVATPGDADPITVEPITSDDQPAVRLSRTRTTKAGQATVVGLADREPNAEIAPPMSVYINGGKRRFRGRVTSAELSADGVLTVTAFDAKRQLKRATFSGSYKDESVGAVVRDILNSVPVRHVIPDRFFALSQIEQEGEEIEPGYRRIVDEQGEGAQSGEDTVGSGGRGSEAGDAGRKYLTVTHDYDEENVAQALTDLAGWSNAKWFVDRDNKVRFVKRFDASEIELNAVLQSNAGSEAPPVRKIVVIGAAGKPQGDRRKPRKSKEPLRGVAGDKSAPQSQTYRYTDRDATTQSMVDNLASVLWEEQLRRAANGEIRLVGRAAPRPLDRVRLPRYIDGRDKYYTVRTVRHEINSDEGYISSIAVGGDPKRQFAKEPDSGQNERTGTGWEGGAGGGAEQPYPDIPGGGAH